MGVLAWDERHDRARYIGGGTWEAYKRAVWEKSVLGNTICPGYPSSDEQEWAGVSIHFFEKGSWGNRAIIDGENTWLVIGLHWEKYWDVDGWANLRRLLGPVYKNSASWLSARFRERKHHRAFRKGQCNYGDSSGGGRWNAALIATSDAAAEAIPTNAPVPAHAANLGNRLRR